MSILKTLEKAPHQLSDEKELVLLNAAKDLFFSKGIRATSMDEIARVAGVSKTTIYRRFKTKKHMFEALIMNAIEEMAANFEKIKLDENKPVESLNNAAHTIRKIAENPEHINVIRQLIAESNNDPELTQEACDVMMSTVPRGLIIFFKNLIANGKMTHDYPEQAAAIFYLICIRGLRPLLNALGKQSDEKKRLTADINMFITGCQIKN